MWQFCFWSPGFQLTLCFNSILWDTVMVLKIGVNLTDYNFLYLQKCWKQKHFYQLTSVYCRNKQYNTWFMSTSVLSWFYCWFSLTCLVFYWNMFCGTLCYHLVIKSNLSINLNNLVDRLNYLFISFNSCCLSRSTTCYFLMRFTVWLQERKLPPSVCWKSKYILMLVETSSILSLCLKYLFSLSFLWLLNCTIKNFVYEE